MATRKNSGNSLRKSALFSASAIVAISAGGAAFAQGVFDDEVIVTAQKREESA